MLEKVQGPTARNESLEGVVTKAMCVWVSRPVTNVCTNVSSRSAVCQAYSIKEKYHTRPASALLLPSMLPVKLAVLPAFQLSIYAYTPYTVHINCLYDYAVSAYTPLQIFEE